MVAPPAPGESRQREALPAAPLVGTAAVEPLSRLRTFSPDRATTVVLSSVSAVRCTRTAPFAVPALVCG